jgi:CheY-like chemotaxis protein
VQTAISGREAVAAWRTAKFDLILMDVEMPDMDGLAATAEIRASERALGRRETPIVAMTARALSEDRERCLAAGMNGYVTKPIRSKTLFDTIESCARPKPPGTPPRGENQMTMEADLGAVLAAVEDDRALAGELLDAFILDARSRLQELHAKAGALDAAGMQAAAHSIKGAAGSLALDGIASIAARAESAARAREEAEAAALLRPLDGHLAALAEQLAGWRRDGAIP